MAQGRMCARFPSGSLLLHDFSLALKRSITHIVSFMAPFRLLSWSVANTAGENMLESAYFMIDVIPALL